MAPYTCPPSTQVTTKQSFFSLFSYLTESYFLKNVFVHVVVVVVVGLQMYSRAAFDVKEEKVAVAGNYNSGGNSNVCFGYAAAPGEYKHPVAGGSFSAPADGRLRAAAIDPSRALHREILFVV